MQSRYFTGKPKMTLADLRGHRNDYPGRCDFPIYRPTGAMLTQFTDCSRSSEWKAEDQRVIGGHRPVPHYCTQHHEIYQRIIRYSGVAESASGGAR